MPLTAGSLVKELKKATGLPAATSFKHVSPAGAAVGLPLTEVEKQNLLGRRYGCRALLRLQAPMQEPEARTVCPLSEILSPCLMSAMLPPHKIIKREVSDGVIAPGYEPEALEILKAKKKGNYNVIEIDPELCAAADRAKRSIWYYV